MSFFFIDPYGHPFSLSTMKEILDRAKTEIMLNFMYYQMIRDWKNPKKKQLCERFFSPDNPRDVMKKVMKNGRFDEFMILDYLHERLGAKYYVPFWVKYGPDEAVKAHRVKYFLIHLSNNFTAFHLMLTFMWKHSDPGSPLSVEGQAPFLFPLKDVANLERLIVKKYFGTGKKISFLDIMENNWRWYFLERHYRDVLKTMEREGKIRVERVTSRTTRGLSGEDILMFNGK
jgi:hypothetical protein